MADIDARVALGLKARTGRAILVAVAGDVREPRFVELAQIPLLPEGAFAPYHVAAELSPAKARLSIERDIATAHALAADGIRKAAGRLRNVGFDIRGCGVLVGPGMPKWSTEEIIAVHVRMHQAEGELFRDVLVAGTRACDLALTTLREKAALDDAAKAMGISRERLDARIATLGRAAGPPWGKDQKEAAAAALAALGKASRS
jgi:hypothetical protein